MKKKRFWKNFFKTSLAVILSVLIFWRLLFFIDFKSESGIENGITFSQKQTKLLKLNWKETYLSILTDLKVKKLRLVAYWDMIELEQGQYDFTDLDWQLDQAAQHNAQVILVVGRRVPRWPECHDPKWLASLSDEKKEQQQFMYVAAVVEHYRNHPALKIWQVENEPFLELFGECPGRNKPLLVREIALVKDLDSKHPVMVTDSGELATWLRTRYLADYLGTSAYRVVYNPWIGYLNYGNLIPPAYYRLKARIINKPVDKIFVSEMQAEPWTTRDLILVPIDEQIKTMSLDQFKSNISFSEHLGFPRVYWWGAEWWYWMRDQGHPEFWEESRGLF